MEYYISSFPIELVIYPPRHFSDWVPITRTTCDAFNKKWATNSKFEELGQNFALFLQNSVSHLTNEFQIKFPLRSQKKSLSNSGLFIKANGAVLQGRSYSHKRFVRIGAEGYHPNALQIYIEGYVGPSISDDMKRHDSDAALTQFGFPIPKDHLGIFVGMSALLDNPERKYRMLERADLTEERIREDFQKLDDATVRAEKWALEFTQNQKSVKIIRTDAVSRLRVKLPFVPIASEEWSVCRIEDALGGLIVHYGELFIELSKP